MSIFVDENTKVVYQGLTGSQGRFYGLLNREYGTQVVAGTNPKKAGTDVDGIPVYATVGEAVEATGATASCIFIPAPGVRSAVMEAAEGGVTFIVAITEGVPAQDEAWFFNKLKRDFPDVQLLGPELPRHHQPRQVQHRHHRRPHRQGPGRGREDRRHRQPVGHAHLPGALRAQAQRHRRVDLRRHRRRPGAGHVVHRLPRALRGRPRDRRRDDDRRDRRVGRGGGRRVHRLEDVQAGRQLHRRGHRPAGQEDGPRRRHRLGRQGHGPGQDGRPARRRRRGRAEPDRGRPR